MRIPIEAELILCGVDVMVEAGQHLIIINGVCVGVHTGTLPHLPGLNGSTRAKVLEPEPELKATAAPAKKKPPVKRKAYKPRAGETLEGLARKAIYDLVSAATGPLTAFDISNLIGTKNTVERSRTSTALGGLIAEGKIVQGPPGPHNWRTYVVAPSEA